MAEKVHSIREITIRPGLETWTFFWKTQKALKRLKLKEGSERSKSKWLTSIVSKIED